MSRRFYFGSPSDSGDDADQDGLPYPEPLARNAFLTPDFTATAFLSSLHNRHQTLEDLRSELRTRSQELSKELLDLVNDNYEEFLGLGNDLRGGDEKVEEVRVGLLGFKREIDALKDKTQARRLEAAGYVRERQGIMRETRIGRDLMEIDTRLDDLERALDITPKTKESKNAREAVVDIDVEFSDGSGSDEDEESTVLLSRIRRRVQQYADMQRLIKRVGAGKHPFLVAHEPRVTKIKQTLLVDLGHLMNTLKQAGRAQEVLSVLQMRDQVLK